MWCLKECAPRMYVMSNPMSFTAPLKRLETVLCPIGWFGLKGEGCVFFTGIDVTIGAPDRVCMSFSNEGGNLQDNSHHLCLRQGSS